jgi:plasmid stabilization system protein ParE
MRVIYHTAAEAEAIEAARYYEQRVPSLGGEFLEELDQAVTVIQESPKIWRLVGHDIRRYLMPRFPFGIYYRIRPDHIRILAVKHHRRHPEYWQTRE